MDNYFSSDGGSDPFGAESFPTEPLSDIPVADDPIINEPIVAAPAAATTVAQDIQAAEEPAAASALPTPTASSSAVTAPAIAESSVSEAASSAAAVPSAAAGGSSLDYFGAAGGDDAFDSIGQQATEANGVASVDGSSDVTTVAASSNVSSYFGGSDDPLGLGGIGSADDGLAHNEPANQPAVGDSNLNYFDNAGSDWLNPAPAQSAQNDPFGSHSNSFPNNTGFPSQTVPPAGPAAVAAAPAPQAPGGPAADPFGAAPAGGSDYFGSEGANDWLASAPQQPVVSAPLAHNPYQPTHAPPTQQPPQLHATPAYGAPSFPPAPATAATPSSLPPSFNEQFNEVDLNSPAKPAFPHQPSRSSSGFDDIPLDGNPPPSFPPPTPSVASHPPVTAAPPQANLYASAAFGGESTRAPPPSSLYDPTRTVPLPGTTAVAPAAVPTLNPYNPYAAESSRPLPTPAAAAPPPSMTNPTPFMPRAPMPDPHAAAMPPTAAAAVPAAHNPSPWQPAPPAAAAAAAVAPPMQNGGYHPPQESPPVSNAALFGTPSNMFAQASGGLASPPRAWAPPPASPCVCFGFGGKLLTIIPRGSPGASSSRPGPVLIQPLSEVLESQPFVQKLTSFPGPLTLPANATAGIKHPRHVELEDLVQAWADKAMYAALPLDSPLAQLAHSQQGAEVQGGKTVKEQVTNNYRSSKRLLYLLLLESLKSSGVIHRSLNPTSLNTLPSVGTGSKLEDAMVNYLVQLDKKDSSAGPASTSSAWLDNASSSHSGDASAIVPSPVRVDAPTHNNPHALQEEQQKQEAALVHMQSLLLKGQRKEACQVAVDSKMWSHALLLASFDMNTYHSVVSKFAASGFSDGSPLQSLYMLFAQQPALLFRGIAGPDGKGMDGQVVPGPHYPYFTANNTPPLMKNWRANLSVMLANPTPNDKQVLTTLGDTLWTNYHLPLGAHLVYLLAGHNLGPEIPGNSLQSALPLGRILLVGADHRKHVRTFATPAAIQRTEVFEYCRQLLATLPPVAGQTPLPYGGLSPPFQLFKLMYAYQLAEVGLLSRALQYCEQLSNTVAHHSKNGKGTLQFPIIFLAALEELETRLRENLNAKAGPGVAKKIVSKLFNWMVGDGSQAAGTTTVVPSSAAGAAAIGPDPSLAQPTNLPRSVSSGAIPNPTHKASPSLSSTQPLHPSSSDFNLGQSHHNTSRSTSNSVDHSGGLPPAQPPKHSRSVTEPQAGISAGKGGDKAAAAEGEGGPKEVKKGIFGSLVGSLWGGKKTGKKVYQASLREEHSFVYDDALGRWVCKDANGNIVEDEAEDKPVAPPTISEEMKAKLSGMGGAAVPPPMPGAPPAVGPGGVSPSGATSGPALPGMPPPSSMFASRGGGTKNRYALADNSFESESTPAPAMPTPGFGVSAPMPGMPAMPSMPGVAPGMPAAPGVAAAAAPVGGFKVFRPSITAPLPPSGAENGVAAHPHGNGSNGNVADGNAQPHNPYGGPAGAPVVAAPMNPYGVPPPAAAPGLPNATRSSTPPKGRLEMNAQPPMPAYGGYNPHNPHNPPMPVGGSGGFDIRAQSTPPMRPGMNVPAGPGGAPGMYGAGAPPPNRAGPYGYGAGYPAAMPGMMPGVAAAGAPGMPPMPMPAPGGYPPQPGMPPQQPYGAAPPMPGGYQPPYGRPQY